MVGVVVIAAAALAASYLLGRLRPWQHLGDWAADQVCFTEAWVRSGAGRQAVVVLVHAVTAPRTSCRIIRTPTTETQALTSRSGLGRQSHPDRQGKRALAGR